MYYRIILASLDINAGEFETHPFDVAGFILRGHTMGDLACNLVTKWAWNIAGWPGFEADGPAIFLQFI